MGYPTVRDIDRKLVKMSNVRIIKCGNIVELYEYAKPYIYNLGKGKQNESVSDEHEGRGARKDSIERARRKIKRLINSNVYVYGRNPIFVTYTFKGNVSSIREANRVFKSHIRDIRRDIVGRSVRYVGVPEIQGRRAEIYGVSVWHFHVVFFDLPYIENIKEKFEKSWGAGWVQIKVIDHVRNVGAYVSKYFSKQWEIEIKQNKYQKAYYSTLNLFQPEVFRNLTDLATFGNLDEEHSQMYPSEKYGSVLYKQFRIRSSVLSTYPHNQNNHDQINSYSQSGVPPLQG